MQANFIRYGGFTVVYRRYASLFFIVGIDNGQVRCLLVACSACITHQDESLAQVGQRASSEFGIALRATALSKRLWPDQ